MASPFHWFRKRQKLLLGVFGVALIFVFTISLGTGTDPLVDLLSGNRSRSSGPKAIAVSWKGGKLRSSDLENLRAQRALVRQYLAVIRQTAQEDGGRPQEDVFSQDLSDRAMLELQLLQERAEEMGISISDEDIKDYLVSLTDDRLPEWQLNEIWENLTGGNYSDVQLFGMLRRELAAHRVREFLVSSGYTISPIQIWDQFNRLERRVHVEMMPIDVDTFLDKVSEPDESELREFFERYKANVPYPMSPTPGFFQRERRAFEYINFDFNAFLESESRQVAANEVREYYEKNKEEFRKKESSVSDLELPENSAATPSPQDGSESAEVSDDSDLEDPVPIPPAPESATTDPSMDAGTEDAGVPEAETDDAPTEESAVDDGTAPDAISEDAPDEEQEAGSSSESDDDSESRLPESTPSPLPQEADNARDDDAEANGISAVDAVSAGNSTAPAPTDTADPTAQTTSDSVDPYQPLEQVEDQIRQILAMPLARQRMDQAMAKTRQRLIPYLQWHRSHTDDKGAGSAPAVDLAAISNDPSLSIETVPLSDELEVATYEIGQSFDISSRDEQLVTVPFAQMAFQRDLQLYQPAAIPMSSGNWPQYLFWVTTIEPAYVPSLEELRDDVVLAWKRQKAFDLAVEDALGVVEQARDNRGQPLQEVCPEPGRKFFEETNVRWLSTGNVPATPGMTPRATQIPSIPGTTEEMLRTIFRMQPGDVEMVSNADKSQVYVVRHVSEAPSEDVRRNIFLRGTGVQEEIQGALRREFLTEWQLAYMHLLDEAQVDWQQNPGE